MTKAKKIITKVLKIIVPVVLLTSGAIAAYYMIQSSIKPEKVLRQEEIFLVQIQEMKSTNERVVVSAQGSVIAARQVVVRPEVSGRIIEISNSLVPGGRFTQGEVMARIDPRDYEFNVESKKEQVANAVYQLKEEKGRQAVSRQEWDLLEDSIPTTQEGRELALRIPQIERAEAALTAAQSALEKAKLDLARTTITAPFNSLVVHEVIDIGHVAGPQSEIATLVGTDEYWVRISVPMEHLSWIRLPDSTHTRGSRAQVSLRNGMGGNIRSCRVIRLLGDLDQVGRLARILVEVKDPLLLHSKKRPAEQMPLLLGSYVTVEILGDMVKDVFVVPRNALRDVEEEVAGADIRTSWVWTIDDESRLQVRKVEILWRLKHEVYVSNGLNDGDRVITSAVPNPIVGMKIQVESAESSGGSLKTESSPTMATISESGGNQ